MIVFKPGRMETRYLPSLCATKNCLNDPREDENYCEKCTAERIAKRIERNRRYRIENSLARAVEAEAPTPKPRNVGWVYFVRGDVDDMVKIGYSCELKSRMSQLQTSMARELLMHCAFMARKEAETYLHEELHQFRVRGEWFLLSPEIKEMIDNTKAGKPPACPGLYWDPDKKTYHTISG